MSNEYSVFQIRGTPIFEFDVSELSEWGVAKFNILLCQQSQMCGTLLNNRKGISFKEQTALS